MSAYILQIGDVQYLDVFAKSLARQLSWRDEHGVTAVLRKPLRATIADLVGVPSSPEFNYFKETPLAHRCQRLLLRGLVLHYWTEIFQGQPFRADRYQHLMTELNAFGQELVE